MTPKQERTAAFKVGFLRKLAELGLTPDEFMQGVKQADLESLPDILTGGAVDVGKSAIGAGLDAARLGTKALGYSALLAPLAIGGITGAASGYLDAPTSHDIEIMRKAEMLSLYERLTREAQERRLRRAAV